MAEAKRVAKETREQRLGRLLQGVLQSPTNHRGMRSEPWEPGMTPEQDRARGVIPYTAKRIPEDLLDEIREALLDRDS